MSLRILGSSLFVPTSEMLEHLRAWNLFFLWGGGGGGTYFSHGDHEQQIKNQEITPLSWLICMVKIIMTTSLGMNDGKQTTRRHGHLPNIPLITGGVKKACWKRSHTTWCNFKCTNSICEGSCLSQGVTTKATTALCCCYLYCSTSLYNKAWLNGQYIKQLNPCRSWGSLVFQV